DFFEEIIQNWIFDKPTVNDLIGSQLNIETWKFAVLILGDYLTHLYAAASENAKASGSSIGEEALKLSPMVSTGGLDSFRGAVFNFVNVDFPLAAIGKYKHLEYINLF